jgi:hypothetical protein
MHPDILQILPILIRMMKKHIPMIIRRTIIRARISYRGRYIPYSTGILSGRSWRENKPED